MTEFPDRFTDALSHAVRASGRPTEQLRQLAAEMETQGILVRRAVRSDIAAIARLVGELSPMGYQHDYTNAEKKFEERIAASPDYFLWAAEADQEIVGTAMLHLQHKLSYRCGTAAHLEDLVIDAGCRGRNIGTLLVGTAILAARTHGCYKLMLTCFEKTATFYERFGFQPHDIGMRLSLKDDLYDARN